MQEGRSLASAAMVERAVMLCEHTAACEACLLSEQAVVVIVTLAPDLEHIFV